MANKTFDGFDHYKSATDWLARSGWLQWQVLGTSYSVSFVTGRNGRGKALQFAGAPILDARAVAVFRDRNNEGFLGAAFTILESTGLTPPASGMWFFFYDLTTVTVQASVHFDEANYSVVVYRGDGTTSGTLMAMSPNNVWTHDVSQFYEFHYKIDGSSGILEVRVSNNVVVTATGNTLSSANAWADGFAFRGSLTPGGANPANFLIDDFYYNDTTTGPGLVPCNSYLGDSSTVTLFAIGNDSVSWTALTGSNWQMISEVQMDGDTSYNSTSTAGNEDRFNFQALTAALDTIYALQVTGAYRKDDGGTRTIQQALKSGSTEVYGATFSLPDTNYSYFTDLFVLNPATGLNWVLTDVNAIKAGYKLTA